MSETRDIQEEPRIGVFICDCGSNIAGVIDTEALAEYANTLTDMGVVYIEGNKYTCATPGQVGIEEAIVEHKLNRVVVASCSPRLHEKTFRRTCERAGLNPFLFQMANLREHSSWVHGSEPEKATEKGKEIIRTAVAKAQYLYSLPKTTVPVTRECLIIGGGVTGISAALSLADQGYKVTLVEKSPSIGGFMAALDKTFPTLDCSICIEGPLLNDVGGHPNITLYTYSEVTSVARFIGSFDCEITRHPRYVIERGEKECNGCGNCADVCPVEVPSEFDQGLAPRKAIYLPFPQAVPMKYTLDMDHCIKCQKCVNACEKNSIDFEMEAEVFVERFGTIIIATGYNLYDARKISQYGYGRYDNVITTFDFERLINASGPTMGKVIKRDGKKPKSITFITCVGSRDKNHNVHCSGFCCMYTVKNALLLKEKYKDEVDVSICFMDMRTPAKNYEEFYDRARMQGVKFINTRVSQVEQDPLTGKLLMYIEAGGQFQVLESDMVVLSQAAVAEGSTKVGEVLNISREASGFLMEAHPKLRPVDTTTAGIFIGGSAQGPKDIPYSVSQGLACAAQAGRVLCRDEWEIEPIVAIVDSDTCNICGRCAKICPFKAITLDKENKIPAEVNPALCQGCGSCAAECPTNSIDQKHFTNKQILNQIRAALSDESGIPPEKKVLTFACNFCSYGGSDTAGVMRMQQKTNTRVIRTMCSGRINKKFVQEAFLLGAGAVAVTGCHINDCHYLTANHQTEKRFKDYGKRLEKMGISPERFKLEWISASEGEKWQLTVNEMCDVVERLGVEKIREENAKTKPLFERQLKKFHDRIDK
ncbi:MAG: FAD-dependent oxidoreductase [Candidatus Hodarchaeales archaeon]|jgi:heterodisulfide reductase subunit A